MTIRDSSVGCLILFLAWASVDCLTLHLQMVNRRSRRWLNDGLVFPCFVHRYSLHCGAVSIHSICLLSNVMIEIHCSSLVPLAKQALHLSDSYVVRIAVDLRNATVLTIMHDALQRWVRCGTHCVFDWTISGLRNTPAAAKKYRTGASFSVCMCRQCRLRIMKLFFLLIFWWYNYIFIQIRGMGSRCCHMAQGPVRFRDRHAYHTRHPKTFTSGLGKPRRGPRGTRQE